jgi:polyhydroxyalkanoate synthase
MLAAKGASRFRSVLGGRKWPAFLQMRSNDLIWEFRVNNYLLGSQPPAFDILLWNEDTTGLLARTLHHGDVDLCKLTLSEGGQPCRRPDRR